MDKKLKNLIAYCQGIYHKENGRMLYNKYLDEIKTISPYELMYIQNEQLKTGLTPKNILTIVDKLINVFYESLSKYKLEDPINIPFVYFLDQENKALTSKLDDFKEIIKSEPLSQNKKLNIFLEQIKLYNEHLLKLENILFPYLEKNNESFNGLQIMWALHDETRQLIKSIEIGINESDNESSIKQKVAYLYFKLYGLVQKQELILFPVAVKFISDDTFAQMHIQSFDYEFPYIQAPKKEDLDNHYSSTTIDALSNVFTTSTGQLKLDELSLLLDALPLDLTFVNEKDEVAYFSKSDKRIFPRSKAIIGRNVRNCHPPQSIHIVEKILQSLKSGQKDTATFWINVNNNMILIKYICLRNDKGEYKGTLEITQEVNSIRALKGEKRLLDWE